MVLEGPRSEEHEVCQDGVDEKLDFSCGMPISSQAIKHSILWLMVNL